MPPQASAGGLAIAAACIPTSEKIENASLHGQRAAPRSSQQGLRSQEGQQPRQDEDEVLTDSHGRPYNLGPKGFVRDLNTRAVKIARRIVDQARVAAAPASDSSAQEKQKNQTVIDAADRVDNDADGAAATSTAATAALKYAATEEVLGISGTVRQEVAQEIQFVIGGRLPFVKRSEVLVWAWVCLSLFFIVRFGIMESGLAPTVGAFTVMYFVLDFYSGVLHVVLDDEWNMHVPLLSQPAMEFQYHHHIPDDGCSRPYVEGMGDLNFIIGLHLALFSALYIRGGGEDKMLLTAGAWKMLIAYWGIWNHRQAHQLKSRRPRWCTYLQSKGIMLTPEAHKVHHTPPHDDEYCLLGVTTWPVTWLGRQNLGSVFWIALFLVLTAFDTVCATRVLRVLFP